MPESGVDDRIIVREAGPEAAVIFFRDSCLNYASGDDTKPRLKEIVSERIAQGRKRLVLNLESIGLIDSCGLAILISLKKHAEAEGGRIVLSNLCALIQRLFALTRLDKAFEIYPSEEMAVGEA